MMFWLGIVIAIIGFAVEFEPAKSWLCSHFSWLSKYLHYVSVAVFVVGLSIAVIDHYQERKEASALHNEITSVRETVHYVKALVTVQVTGDWTNGRGPNGNLSPTLAPQGKIIGVAKLVYNTTLLGSVALDLKGTATLERQEDGTINVSYEAETQTDSTIVGCPVEQFEQAQELHVTPIFDFPRVETTDGTIVIHSVQVRIEVNATHHYTITLQPSEPVRCRFNSMLVLPLEGKGLQADEDTKSSSG